MDGPGLLLLTGSGEEGLLGDLLLITGLGGGIRDSSWIGFVSDSGDILLGDFLPSFSLGAPLPGLGDLDFTSLLDPLTEAAKLLLLFAKPLLSLLLSSEASLRLCCIVPFAPGVIT